MEYTTNIKTFMDVQNLIFYTDHDTVNVKIQFFDKSNKINSNTYNIQKSLTVLKLNTESRDMTRPLYITIANPETLLHFQILNNIPDIHSNELHICIFDPTTTHPPLPLMQPTPMYSSNTEIIDI
jgi:hypothetical protein